jgi:ABC-type antimicrobial peptide transport system permease subunit
LLGIGIGIPLYAILHDAAPSAWGLIVDLLSNIALVEATFVLIMLLVAVLLFLTTLIARTPALGIPDIKISLRALVINRNRVSATLLALVIGVLTLSLITMFATSLKRFFEFNLEENLGGNVIVGVNVAGSDWQEILRDLESVLSTSEGINDYNIIANYQVDFVAIEKADGTRLKRNELIAQMQENTSGSDFEDFLDITLGQMDGRYVNRTLPDKKFEGNNRQLVPEDTGRPVVVISGNRAVVAAGIEAGDYLIVNFPASTSSQPSQIRFEIVGVSDESLGDISSDVGSPIYAPINSFGGIRPNFIGGVVDIEDDQISAFRRRILDEVESTFVIETRFLNQIVTKLINQFTSLPILVAILNLITGGAVIANSVALSTLERRREIGVMKSLGVQRERVLGMLLLENGLMGFLGGIIGVGASLLLLIFLWSLLFEGDLKGTLPVGTALMLMIVCVGISLVAAILTAWGASGEKPLTVLRNE